ncbi:MAG: tRNA guanosine(34) transglycosylase Tgt [Thermoplasmata archaeon]|nr:MAG: tRNA guanosine(34) transglycosylase Tgt [Thermoplasmata archaeon]
MFEVDVTDKDSDARVGELNVNDRTLKTPGFLPVATKADVKLVSPDELKGLGVEGVISNAFLLYLRPGIEVIEKAGGLHNFMAWDRLVFTDSGGFQILNKDFLLKVGEGSVTFKSPFDGEKHDFTPEKCAEIQMKIGGDVALTLDDCPMYGSDYEKVVESTKRTIVWAEKFKYSHITPSQKVFGIVQGGVFPDLRRKCAESLVDMDFNGYAIGGLCIGEPKDLMHEVIQLTAPLLPSDKPRYLMGVGSPEDMLEAISHGIDLFDSVFPTRNARHNTIYTKGGKINIGKEKFNSEFGPLDEDCQCYTCRNFSLAYVNHLLREHEYLGMRLATLHNLHFLVNLMKMARDAIEEGMFLRFKKEFLNNYLGK